MEGKKKSGKFSRFFVAAVVMVFTVLTVWADVGLSAPQPTILFQCMDFRLIEDGSIQALVQVSAENMEYFTGTAFNIDFNPSYIRPSYLETSNGKESQSVIENRTDERRYFEEKDALTVTQNSDNSTRSPFYLPGASDIPADWNFSWVEPGTVTGAATDRGSLSMYLTLDQNLAKKIKPHTIVKEAQLISGSTTPTNTRLIIDAQGNVDPDTGKDGYSGGTGAGKGINLGTLSFQVNPDRLTEMVQTFGSTTTPPGEFLIGHPGQPKWMIGTLAEDDYTPGDLAVRRYTESDKTGGVPSGVEAKFEFKFVFPKVLVKATVAGGNKIALNAYQNYTTGTVADLAESVQRYRPEITAGYADGNSENFIMNWGQAGADPAYTVYRPAAAGETAAYADGDGKGWVVLGAGEYNPRGGEYLVGQYFFYEEGGATKKFPVPLYVYVDVEHVTLSGVDVVNQKESYKHATADTPDFTMDNLHLPKSALLSVTPVPGSVVLSMPINSWTPNTLAGLTTSLGGVAWPAEGSYTLAGPDAAAIKSYVNSNCKWVTVPDSFAGAVSVTRDVVSDSATGFDEYTANRYSVENVATTPDGVAHFVVTKKDAAGTGVEPLASDAEFRLYLPNGSVVDTRDELPQKPTAPTDGSAYYLPEENGGSYALSYYPGTLPNKTPQREDVRRSINLGGWFYVSVYEDATWGWSNPVPVYVAPRANYYTQSYIVDDAFDYTGFRAGLLPFYTDSNLSTNVVLPVGDTVATTYNGATGAEPGTLGQFRVSNAAQRGIQDSLAGPVGGATGKLWAADKAITYGVEDLIDNHYNGFGKVVNLAAPNGKQVEINTEPRGANSPVEQIKLTYGDPSDHGITWAGGEVDIVDYNVCTQGYVSRQTYTLTIENTGAADIYGLSVDVESGIYAPTNENHFEVTRQPSGYLAVGGKTTFTVTYMYNLSAGADGMTYRDTLLISSNQSDTIKEFDARFKVTNKPVYNVTLEVDPVDEEMGTAKLIRGLSENTPAPPANEGDSVNGGTGAANKPDTLPAGAIYEEDHRYVWILAETKDEYKVESVTYMDGGTTHKAYVYEYTADPSVDGDKDLTAYFVQMPRHDVTITVKFYEPISSKLRLSELRAYSGKNGNVPDGDMLNGSLMENAVDTERDVWWGAHTSTKVSKPMTAEDSSQENLLVVLDAGEEADTIMAQLHAVLRGRPSPYDISPVWVKMDIMDGAEANRSIHSDANGNTLADPAASPPVEPTKHTSAIFTAPKQGASVTVDLTLTYILTYATPDYPTASPSAPATVSRTTHIKIVRKSETVVHTMMYGNSPYGMIMSADNITDKNAAWTAFLQKNRFDPAYTPTAAGTLTNTYWKEAWDGAVNYDHDEYAMFVLLGQDYTDPGVVNVLNSAGDPVLAKDIRRIVKVDLLDDAAATQAGRFAGKQTVADTVDTVELTLGTVDVPLVENWWHYAADADEGDYLIRPGVYTLQYTFTDFNGLDVVAMERPFIILSAVGDINADRFVGAGSGGEDDGALIQDRVTNPLGYTATDYADAKLYRYRVCDVNNDRNLNNIDSNQIYYGADIIIPYYLPTGYAP